MLASIVVVSSKMPKNVKDVEGPSTLDNFTGVLILSHRDSIAVKLFMQLSVLADPAGKNHPSSEASVSLRNCDAIPSGLHQTDN